MIADGDADVVDLAINVMITIMITININNIIVNSV